MPKLGLTMTEGTIAEWLVAPGDAFEAQTVLAIVETDKIANELEAPVAGRMIAHLHAAGSDVAVGEAIATYASDAAGDGPVEPAPVAPSLSEPAEPPATSLPAEPAPTPVADGQRIVASPYGRKLAREAGLDLHGVSGTGYQGRIVAHDVVRQAARMVDAPRPEPSAAATAFPARLIVLGRRIALGPLHKLLEGLTPRDSRSLTTFDALILAANRAIGADGAAHLSIARGVAGPGRIVTRAAATRLTATAAAIDAAADAAGEAVAAHIVDLSASGHHFGWCLSPAWPLVLSLGADARDAGDERVAELTLVATARDPDPDGLLAEVCTHLADPLLLLC